jgi:hypothetical protein
MLPSDMTKVIIKSTANTTATTIQKTAVHGLSDIPRARMTGRQEWRILRLARAMNRARISAAREGAPSERTHSGDIVRESVHGILA